MFYKKQERIPNICATEVKDIFANRNSAQDIADAYAIIHNHFWVAVDDEYDYEEGSPQHKTACAVTDAWRELIIEYTQRIFEILREEGISIPTTGQMKVIEPFMERFGYKNNSFWAENQTEE